MIASCILALALDSAFFAGPITVGSLNATQLPEVSGITAVSKEALWVINDSGTEPILYTINTGGQLARTFTHPMLANKDWEDIAFCNGVAYIADIGDNKAERRSIQIYKVRGTTVEVKPFVYPDGPRDAETILADPLTNSLVIISKREKNCRIYAVPQTNWKASNLYDTLVFKGTLPFFSVVSGSVSHDGSEILLKTYTHLYYWKRNGKEPITTTLQRAPQEVTYMPEPQGESIAWAADGTGYYTTTEREDGGSSAPLYFYQRVSSRADQHSTKAISVMPLTVSKKSDGTYTLAYTLSEQREVSIKVVNEIGLTTKIISEGALENGQQTKEMLLQNIPTGTYVLQVRYGADYSAVVLQIP